MTLTIGDMMDRLATIVRTLEEGKLSLEESLIIYEEGVVLSKKIDGKIRETEQRVSQVLKNNEIVPFERNR